MLVVSLHPGGHVLQDLRMLLYFLAQGSRDVTTFTGELDSARVGNSGTMPTAVTLCCFLHASCCQTRAWVGAR